jgi:hypothetical protein
MDMLGLGLFGIMLLVLWASCFLILLLISAIYYSILCYWGFPFVIAVDLIISCFLILMYPFTASDTSSLGSYLFPITKKIFAPMMIFPVKIWQWNLKVLGENFKTTDNVISEK